MKDNGEVYDQNSSNYFNRFHKWACSRTDVRSIRISLLKFKLMSIIFLFLLLRFETSFEYKLNGCLKYILFLFITVDSFGR